MDINKHRQAIVKTILRGCALQCATGISGATSLAFGINSAGYENEDENSFHDHRSSCIATGFFFPDTLAEMQTTCSDYGDVWMGLWLDDQVKLDEDSTGFPDEEKKWYLFKTGDGNTLFPRWLAEVLNEECKLGIKEEDIYD